MTRPGKRSSNRNPVTPVEGDVETDASSEKEERKRALKKALDLLSRRDHATKEIQQKLLIRGIEDTVIDGVLEYLFEKNYLNDRRFAESFVRMRADKGYGERDIRARLSERGISKHDIHQALDNFDTDWFQRAIAVWRKKYRQMSDEKRKHNVRERGARFLRSRGFTSEQTFAALDSDPELDDTTDPEFEHGFQDH